MKRATLLLIFFFIQAALGVAQEPIEHSLLALPGKEVPVLTKKETVKMVTDLGDVIIEVYPEAAPNAAGRFLELVKSGFYDETPIFRVVPGFVVQFGINWREPHVNWKEQSFDDDPTLFSLDRGTLAFAKAGPNTNSTQVFINFGNNNRLAAPEYNFTTFGKVVKGMEIVDKFPAVGDPSMGLDQSELWSHGDTYLEGLDERPAMIRKAIVLPLDPSQE